ncbi:MAG TPA: type VI secretion system tip protein VgrG [Gammaproteobacteria bacterium]|nr:type VI secretion system tip protein VgrG [Gammaproteobacteria bacterium]HRF45094.1 type VI secretion system tip protein TssI/VgrG [Candidatus Competibacteraceae bacterium]
MAATQKHRIFAVNTPLGEDVLLFYRMIATEQLGRLFEYELELLSERTDIELTEVLGKNMTVRVQLPESRGSGTRYFNGFVTRFSYLGMRGMRYGAYRATLSPWLWFLTRTSDCRIFQEKTIPQIIEAIFQQQGFTDFKKSLSGQYPTLEYCVQYRETNFNFVSRLMEQAGIYYYFKHENGKHLLVLADDYSAHGTFPNYDEIPYYPPDVMQWKERDHIYEWTVEKQVQPGGYSLNDFDFTSPAKTLRQVVNMPKSHAMAKFEVYDYPGEYTEASDGDNYTKIRLQELLAQHEILQGLGVVRGAATGYLFSLTNSGRQDQNRQYLVVAASYELQSDPYESTPNPEWVGKPYQVRITAIDAQQPYRAPRITPKPVVQGPQTAIVVGPSGEEIYTDQYGRVKCHFHWDRHDNADENSSCWIRVAQSWAGKKWGAIYLPRIGQEVIVDFLEGNPNLPIITGRVYNGANLPPYTLPDKKTMSTLKSLSSKGGDGFNEFRFEDDKGKEQIFLHGERDEDIRIKNDAREWIGSERHLIVKKKQFEQVEGEKHLIVKSGDGGSGDQFEKIAGEKHQQVVGNYNQKVDGTLSLKVGMNQQEKVGQNHALDAGMEIHLKAGMKVVIEAGMQLTIKAGANFIDLGPSGITISGAPMVKIAGSPMVMINSGGGSAGSGSGSSPDAPTAPTAPQEAADDQAGEVTSAEATPIQAPSPQSLDSVSVDDYQQAPQAQVKSSAAQSGAPFTQTERTQEPRTQEPRTQEPPHAQEQQTQEEQQQRAQEPRTPPR